jgi:hypothetical protein
MEKEILNNALFRYTVTFFFCAKFPSAAVIPYLGRIPPSLNTVAAFLLYTEETFHVDHHRRLLGSQEKKLRCEC